MTLARGLKKKKGMREVRIILPYNISTKAHDYNWGQLLLSTSCKPSDVFGTDGQKHCLRVIVN